MIDYSIWL